MPNPSKSILLGTALLAGIAIAAGAAPPDRTGNNAAGPVAAGPNGQSPGPQIAALPPSGEAAAGNSTVLPQVTVLAPKPYPQPYYDGGGPRVSSYSTPRTEHYAVPPDYAANAALHPYTSGLGPHAGSNGTVRVEHYQMPSNYDPYTSGLSPCVQGKSHGCQVPHSHYNH